MNRSRPQNRSINETALPWQSSVIAAEQGASQPIPARGRVTGDPAQRMARDRRGVWPI